LKNVDVDDLVNTGDDSHWVCQQDYELPNGQRIHPTNFDLSANGAMVCGIEIIRSQEVQCTNVVVDNLNSEEGAAIGIHVRGDLNDQTGYEQGEFGVRWEKSRVGKLVAGSGKEAMPLKAENHNMDLGGLKFNEPTKLANDFHVPKVTLHYQFPNRPIFTNDFDGGPDPFPLVTKWSDYALGRSRFNTHGKLLEWRLKALAYYKIKFGVETPEDVSSYGIDDTIPITNSKDSFIGLFMVDPEQHYHPTTICFDDKRRCTQLQSNASIHDLGFGLYIGKSGMLLTGT
jgi:hypothetical protein